MISNSGSTQPRLIRLGFLILSLGIVFYPVPLAQADLADPPKLVSIKQVTQGPYKPGDRITFAIQHTGGFPGIASVSVSGDCFSYEHSLSWNSTGKYGNRTFSDSNLHNAYTLSGTIRNCESKEYRLDRVILVDQTLLSYNCEIRRLDPEYYCNKWDEGNRAGVKLLRDDISYQVVNLSRAPAGTFISTKKSDDFGFSLPSIVDYKQSPVIIPLAQTTSQGNLISYVIPLLSDFACSFIYRYPADIPQAIELKKHQRFECTLDYGTPDYNLSYFVGLRATHTFKLRTIESSSTPTPTPIPSKSVMFKNSTITCVKGKSSLKVIGKNPKCPSGYKKK